MTTVKLPMSIFTTVEAGGPSFILHYKQLARAMAMQEYFGRGTRLRYSPTKDAWRLEVY